MRKVLIQKPGKDNASQIAMVCSEGWKQTVQGLCSESYQEQNIHHWYNQSRVENDIANGVYTHVAFADNHFAGVIGGGLTSAGVGEIFVLYVDEYFRYQGIGKNLLKELTKEQQRQGAREQWVSVQEGNNRGIPFYEARGFVFQKKHEKDQVSSLISLRYQRCIHE